MFDTLHIKMKFKCLISKLLLKILISKKVKSIFGGKVKALISGGAALNPEIGFFFNKDWILSIAGLRTN